MKKLLVLFLLIASVCFGESFTVEIRDTPSIPLIDMVVYYGSGVSGSPYDGESSSVFRGTMTAVGVPLGHWWVSAFVRVTCTNSHNKVVTRTFWFGGDSPTDRGIEMNYVDSGASASWEMGREDVVWDYRLHLILEGSGSATLRASAPFLASIDEYVHAPCSTTFELGSVTNDVLVCSVYLYAGTDGYAPVTLVNGSLPFVENVVEQTRTVYVTSHYDAPIVTPTNPPPIFVPPDPNTSNDVPPVYNPPPPPNPELPPDAPANDSNMSALLNAIGEALNGLANSFTSGINALGQALNGIGKKLDDLKNFFTGSAAEPELPEVDMPEVELHPVEDLAQQVVSSADSHINSISVPFHDLRNLIDGKEVVFGSTSQVQLPFMASQTFSVSLSYPILAVFRLFVLAFFSYRSAAALLKMIHRSIQSLPI